MSITNPTRPRGRGEQPIEKAARLLADDRVALSPSASVYLVRGDSATYRVVVDDDGIFCPCPASTPLCSHVLAAASARAIETAPDPVCCERCDDEIRSGDPAPGGLCSDCFDELECSEVYR